MTPMTPAEIEATRPRFEKWIVVPPRMHTTTRHDTVRIPDDYHPYHRPGSYKEYAVQMAWESWCEALKT